MEALRAQFRPEFLNRVDETVVFRGLSRDDLRRIIEIQLERLRKRLAEHHIELALSDAAKDHLAAAGYDPVYGARPLKRLLQREVETVLARKILSGELPDNSRVSVGVSGGELSFEIAPLAQAA
jgi:ATP-dependent Clp protease ATP-binding subunit ClpB